MTQNRLLTVGEVAEQLSVSIPAVYLLVRDREIETTRVRSSVRFTQDAVDRYLAAHTIPPVGAK